MKQRLLGALFAVGVSAVCLAITEASAICAIYTPDDVQWYVFFCYLNA